MLIKTMRKYESVYGIAVVASAAIYTLTGLYRLCSGRCDMVDHVPNVTAVELCGNKQQNPLVTPRLISTLWCLCHNG